MTLRPVVPTLRLPRGVQSFDMAMQQLERADARNVKRDQIPSLPALILWAPSGGAYQLSVTDAGALSIVQVPRDADPP